MEWIQENKDYPEETKIQFKLKNFERDIGEPSKSFDLLLSLSAGIVSKPCAKYLKTDGYFLVSDAHFDARMMFLDSRFHLVGIWDDSAGRI